VNSLISRPRFSTNLKVFLAEIRVKPGRVNIADFLPPEKGKTSYSALCVYK